MRAENIMTTVSLHPRHSRYLKELKLMHGQGASDTVRRALDEYMAKHPVDELDPTMRQEDGDADSKRN